MATVAIELNDVGVVASSVNWRWQGRSPGFAMLDGERFLVGAEALAQARVKPRRVASKFWDQPESAPVERSLPRHLSHGDLVHAHLSEIWKAICGDLHQRSSNGIDDKGAIDHVDAVILTLPGIYSSRELSLILGIARACEMPVKGMVDAAVAASTGAVEAERILHLDVLLHRVVITELDRSKRLVRRRVESERNVGWSMMMDRWAKLIAGRFVHQTRFDPFHQGATEQNLYDLLPKWIDEIQRGEGALVALEHQGQSHRAEITTDQLQEAARSSYQRIVDLARSVAATGSRPALVLSENLSRLPGLRSELEKALGTDAVILASAAAAMGALEHAQLLARSGQHEVDFVIELPSEPTTAEPAALSEEVSEDLVDLDATIESPSIAPTHLLYESTAYALDSEPLSLGTAELSVTRGIKLIGNTAGVSRRHCSLQVRGNDVIVEDHSTYGTFLNGRRVDGKARLMTGDQLRVGTPGIVLHLIAVK